MATVGLSFNRILTIAIETNFPILYSVKTPKHLWFFGVFRGYKTEQLVRNELTPPFSEDIETSLLDIIVSCNKQSLNIDSTVV